MFVISQQGLSSYTEWPKMSENMTLYDSVIVDLTPLNFTYLNFIYILRSCYRP